ncbi:DNA-binding transcriptional regulator Fis [Aliikangiella maris]|uniref:DNA-binding transcriptional regulator Fis n=2 Tax=Aliikangiella maris TaxID=3162458 RepID=A0ABV3MTH3_9GAMM
MNLETVETLEQKESSSFEIVNQQTTLRESVEQAMKNYFAQLEDEKPTDIYNLVLAEVEAPLMETVMAYTQGNQTKASQVLGLNRGTLRKKLKMYGLN